MDELAQAAFEALRAQFGRHDGHRAAHAKGRWAQGTITGLEGATALCRAPLFDGTPHRALVRFSNGSGDPSAHDGTRDGRGMAVKVFLADGSDTDLVTLTVPSFMVATPEDFVELLGLVRPDPETGQPDLARLGPFLEARPATAAAIQARFSIGPTASYLAHEYNGIHSFRWTAADGTQRWVRTRFVPEGGVEELTDEDAQARDADFLAADLRERLAAGPAAFTVVARIAAAGDAIDDPTLPWPEERESVAVARLVLEQAIDSPETASDIHVFDPLRLCDGIEPSADRILHFRRRVYDLSARARWTPDTAAVV